MKHRLLSLLLVLILLCAILPQAGAEDEPVYSGSCGDDLSWRFDPESGVLTLEGSGEMDDCWGGAPWSAFSDQIRTVSLPQGLTCVADGAFSECAALTELLLPDTVTQIGWYAFSGCAALTEITVPGSVEEIGEGPSSSAPPCPPCASAAASPTSATAPSGTARACGASRFPAA